MINYYMEKGEIDSNFIQILYLDNRKVASTSY